jgi:2-polyprenyl-6-methoxyphenol hydroxylase-like FAD-dependent oxidoreductase
MSSLTDPIVIIGGGIAGLCTAIALRQGGHDAHVYEQTEQIRAVGAGLTLWPNALNVLAELGLAEAVRQAGAEINKTQIRTDRGRVLTQTHLHNLAPQLGYPAIAIHRADLHQILLAALPPEATHLNHTFSRFEQDGQGVTVHFDNGEVVRSQWLIGADGLRSRVRMQMWPETRPRYSGYVAWRGVVEGVHHLVQGITSESWGRGARFGIVPLNERQVYWFATGNERDGAKGRHGDAAREKEQLLARFRDWHEPVEALLRATPTEAILRNPLADLKPLRQWSQGRVTLVGDAAHATTPNMGQGACQAIESALVLARTIQQEPLFAAYEAARHTRTAWITNSSWQIGAVGQWQNPVLCALRNQMIALTPESVLKRRLIAAATFPQP